jgi:hypothetical protein
LARATLGPDVAGVLPLAQVVHNSVADEPYARIYSFAS